MSLSTIAILFITLFTSCDRNLHCISDRIKTIKIDGSLIEYKYDSDPPALTSKLISITGPSYIITYDYSVPGEVTKKTNSANPFRYKLNNIGAAICEIDRNPACVLGNPYSFVYVNLYAVGVYDAAGFLSRTITNGDITSERRNGNLVDTITYTNLCSPLENQEGIFGKNNAHWPDIFTHDGAVTNNSYETDALGRVTKRTMTGGMNQVWEITYY